MGEFKKIKDACLATGLSQYYLRQGCKSDTIPHIRSGSVYYIDMDAMYDALRNDVKNKKTETRPEGDSE